MKALNDEIQATREVKTGWIASEGQLGKNSDPLSTNKLGLVLAPVFPVLWAAL
jgi:hypothetical protein